MSKPCIICCTQLSCSKDNIGNSSDGDLSSLEGSERLKRFFELVERYLNLDDVRENDKDKGQQGGVVKRFPIEEVVDTGFITCGGCSKIVDSFCDLYHQMKAIELKINRRLWTLKNIISSAQRVPGKTKKFREDFIRKQRELNWQDWDNDNDILSEQKIDLFLGYKKELVRKCRRKLGESYPKLVIRRIRPSQKENALPHSTESTFPSSVISDRSKNGSCPALIDDNQDQGSTTGNVADHDEFLPMDFDDNTESTPEPPQVKSGYEITALPEQENLNSTKVTPSRLRTVYQCPKCKKTFSSAVKLDQHQKSHESDMQAIPVGESIEDEEGDDDQSDYERDNTFDPLIMEHFQNEFKHETDTHDDANRGIIRVQHEVIPLIFSANHENANDDHDEVEVDPSLGSLAIKAEPNDEDVDSESDSEIDYLEDSNESSGESQDDTSSSPSNFKRSNLKTGTTKRGTERKKASHPPVKIIPMKKHQCSQCARAFYSKHNLARHVKVIHLKILDFVCEICGKGFGRDSQLKEHVTVAHHHKYKCPDCEREFNLRPSLKHHQMVVHMGIIPGRVKCEECDAELANNASLSRHRRTLHRGIKETRVKSTCPDCKKTLSSKASLRHHRMCCPLGNVTGGNKKFTCKICGLGFFVNYYLKRHHKVVHLKLREFVCDVCGKSFQRANRLKKHKESQHMGV